MIDGLIRKIRSPRLPSLLRRSVGKVITPRLQSYYEFRALFQDKVGLELGGPSPMFKPRGLFPIYRAAVRVDNCNFGADTVWEGHIGGGASFQHGSRDPGEQYIAEATNLDFASKLSYDFILSSHMLEHSANPIKALLEWQRVLKPGGALFLVLPHKDGTFDHRRPVTTLEHLVRDFEHQMDEGDLTHLPEILAFHDLSMDPEAGSPAKFEARSKRNIENRCLHHHVFDARSAVALVDYARFQIHSVETAHPFHIAILATKGTAGADVDNERFKGSQADFRRISPFPSDKFPAG
jgi:hypothetical protein